MPPKFYHRAMYIAPSRDHILLNLNMLFKLIIRRSEFSDVWNENAALVKRLMEIHSNPPILYMYYGFKGEASPIMQIG